MLVKKISDRLPSVSFDAAAIKLPKFVKLSDLLHDVQVDIDMRLGADDF